MQSGRAMAKDQTQSYNETLQAVKAELDLLQQRLATHAAQQPLRPTDQTMVAHIIAVRNMLWKANRYMEVELPNLYKPE